VRALLDPNVLISALLAGGSPAKVLRSWPDGAYELVVSPLLLEELERTLTYRKVCEHVRTHEWLALLNLLRRQAQLMDDPTEPPPLRSPDPGDDYLIVLASAAGASLISGANHLLCLGRQFPMYSPAAFLARLESAL